MKKVTKATRTTIFLILYLIVLAAYTLPTYRESGNWGEYVAVIAASLAIFALLHYVLSRRERFRAEQRKQQNSPKS